MIILLTYSCVYVPLEVAFLEAATGMDKVLGLLVDALFFVDIYVNFLSAYEVPGSNSYEVRLSVLAKEYLTGWFFVDLIACLPIDIFELIIGSFSESADPGKGARYAKLARIPRIYRIVRIIRIFKIFKIFKYHKGVKRQLTKLKLNSGTIRVVKIIAAALFAVHVMACVWFMQARLHDFEPSTWVYNM
jgi:hyperpolarization activated cyclic nucleotide-gated potassium channel 2